MNVNTNFRNPGFRSFILASMLMLSAACDVESPAPLEPAAPSFALQMAPVRNDGIVALPFFVVDESGNAIDPATTPAGTELFDARAWAAGGDIVPVSAPDGHTVTWGEFSAARGEISAKCVEAGTQVVLRLSNLIPGGVYTIWNVTFSEAGFQVPHPLFLAPSFIGVGPSGPSDGSRNTFRASASGRASISTITPEGPLGTFGEIGGCALTDEFEWHVAGLYHMDGLSHGSDLGPIGTMAEQFAFIFIAGQ
jgi:hypothetical protein